MRFITRWMAFDLPEGLLDGTTYEFEAEDPLERFSLGSSPVEEGQGGVDRRVEEMREEMEDLYEGRLSVEEQGPKTVDGVTGAMLRMRVEQDGETSDVWTVVLPHGDQGRLTLVYSSGRRTDRAERFERIVDGVRLAPGRPRTGVAAAGFARFTLFGIDVDLPARLQPPTTYRFCDADEELTILMNVYPAELPERTPPELADEVDGDTDYGGLVTDHEEQQRAVDDVVCRIARYVVSEEGPTDPDDDPDRRAVCRARITGPGRPDLSLVGELDARRRDQLHAVFDQFIEAVVGGD